MRAAFPAVTRPATSGPRQFHRTRCGTLSELLVAWCHLAERRFETAVRQRAGQVPFRERRIWTTSGVRYNVYLLIAQRSILRAMPAPAQFAPRALPGLKRKAPAKPVTAPIAASKNLCPMTPVKSLAGSAPKRRFSGIKDRRFNGLQMFEPRFISVYQGRDQNRTQLSLSPIAIARSRQLASRAPKGTSQVVGFSGPNSYPVR